MGRRLPDRPLLARLQIGLKLVCSSRVTSAGKHQNASPAVAPPAINGRGGGAVKKGRRAPFIFKVAISPAYHQEAANVPASGLDQALWFLGSSLSCAYSNPPRANC
jgi:hypothetical protein